MPILVLAQHDWDHEQMRPAVREAFRKVLDCGTAALGAEVFASDNEERGRLPHVQVPRLPELRLPGHDALAA